MVPCAVFSLFSAAGCVFGVVDAEYGEYVPDSLRVEWGVERDDAPPEDEYKERGRDGAIGCCDLLNFSRIAETELAGAVQSIDGVKVAGGEEEEEAAFEEEEEEEEEDCTEAEIGVAIEDEDTEDIGYDCACPCREEVDDEGEREPEGETV